MITPINQLSDDLTPTSYGFNFITSAFSVDDDDIDDDDIDDDDLEVDDIDIVEVDEDVDPVIDDADLDDDLDLDEDDEDDEDDVI